MKPVGVILNFDKQTVQYVTPGRAVKAGTPSPKHIASVSAKMPPTKPKK